MLRYRGDTMRLCRGVLSLLALTLVGCGQSARIDDQSRVLAYQTKIGRINAPFAHPPAAPDLAEAMLANAIKQYQRLSTPAVLRKDELLVVAGLRAELRSLRQGAAATAAGDAAALKAAESRNTRARRLVGKALVMLTRQINECRANASDC
jgi:hypothetical protein